MTNISYKDHLTGEKWNLIFQHLSSSKTQPTSFGLLCLIDALAYSSPGGDSFSVADVNMDKILIQTADVFKAGVQSEYKVDKHI